MSKAESHPLIEPFLDALWLERGLSDNTVSSYRTDLEKFALWLDEQGGSLLLAGLDDIQHYLAWRVDHQFAASSTARFLSALRRFYQYLNREKLRSDDPTVLLEGPKLPKKLPSDLSEAEVEALLQAPLVDDPLELRDKAMLELLYATGLRVSELVGLTAEHVSLRQGLVRVVGKGNKERLVPMGEEAVHWLERYYREGRTLLLGGTSSDVVFPSKRARMMTRQTFWHRIKLYALRAGIRGELSPTPCVTPSPPTCSITAPICEWCRCCWATRISPPLRSIPTWPTSGSRHCTASTTPEPDRLTGLATKNRPKAVFFSTRQGGNGYFPCWDFSKSRISVSSS